MALFGKKKEGEEEKPEEKKEETPATPAKPETSDQDQAGKLGETSEEKAARLELEEAAQGREEEKAPGVEELVLRLEKMDGRLAAAEEARARMDDRLARMSEQIGELRTMGLERERSMGLMEADFELIKAVFEEVKPSEIAKELGSEKHLHLWPDKSLGGQSVADRMPNPRKYLERLEHWWHRISEWPK